MSQESFAALTAVILLIAYFFYQRPQLREERAWNESALLRYSHLHLFTTTLNEIGKPQEIVERMLDRTLQALDSEIGFFLLQSPPPEDLRCWSVRGISESAMAQLSSQPMRKYLAGSGKGWDRQMVFADLRRAGSMASLERDPAFREFQSLMLAQGVKTLVAETLRSKERSYGLLWVGSRRLRTYQPGELRLLSAIGHQISATLENRYLHQVAERHQEEIKILHHVSEALSSAPDPEVQIKILRTELRGVLGSTNFSLSFRDSSGGPIETVLAFDREDAEPALEGPELVASVFRRRSPLLLTNNAPDKARLLGIKTVDPRIRTWGGVPLRFSDGSMGVLAVADFEKEYALDEEQFKFLQALAAGITVTIENARSFQREQRRARHLELLNELGRRASSLLDPRQLLRDICPQARKAFGYDQIRIETLDRKLDGLVVEAQDGYDSTILGQRSKVGRGLAGIAAETGAPILANRVKTDARYISVDSRVQSAMSIPIKVGKTVLGVITFESFRPDGFSTQDVVTLGMFADQLAIALHTARSYQSAQERAITDSLTGLKTHRYFHETLMAEWRRAPRSGRPLSVIMMDLDNFKPVNDKHGHVEGDKVLCAVARIIEARSRQSSTAARYGGDEFALLMPETTLSQAELLADRLRASLESDPYLSEHGVTASLGIATFPLHGATPEEVLRIADSGTYLAKHVGGNQVRLASLSEPSAQVEAYLGVALHRMISTGPDTFEHYLEHIQRATKGPSEEGPSLLDTVTALAFVIDAKDPYTQGHSQAVSRLASAMANQLGMSETEVEEIRLAGILHDIGKIGIPEQLLNKAARLTDEEYAIMKDHVMLGWRILSPLKAKAIERIGLMVRHHHERMDGLGYPDGLKGDMIPLGARILKIADAFDTIVSERAYQSARTIEEALGELRKGRGLMFDPHLVDFFLQSHELLVDPRAQGSSEEMVN